MPSVTRFTDMNEYENASKPDQPFTRPVAFLRNSAGVAFVSDAMGCLPLSSIPLDVTPSAVDQQIALHRALLLIEVDDRRLQDAILVRTARVDRERGADLHGALALVDVAME